MEQGGASDFGGQGGNTKPPARITQSKYWCFTWNNYPENWLEQMEQVKCLWIVGKEVGESGTPHLQGYLELQTKARWSEFGLPKTIHWEKRKGTREDNIRYCAKDGDVYGPLAPEEIVITPYEELKDWQKEIVEKSFTKANSRDVNWYWSSKGGVGKTEVQRYLCATQKDRCLFVNGKGDNIRCAIALHIKETGVMPKVICMNIPCSVEHISYTAIEEIKDGLMFSGKYESRMVLINSPHVFVFANQEPNYEKMMSDRWKVKFIPS